MESKKILFLKNNPLLILKYVIFNIFENVDFCKKQQLFLKEKNEFDECFLKSQKLNVLTFKMSLTYLILTFIYEINFEEFSFFIEHDSSKLMELFTISNYFK